MKNIDIKEMNAEQRLTFAILKTNSYGRWLLIEIAEEYKYTFFDKNYKQWMKITLNMSKMRGNEMNLYQILRM